MDAPSRALADFAASLPDDVPAPRVVRAIARHLVDSFACMLGALEAPPVRIARGLAEGTRCSPGASVLGLAHLTAPEYAAFANTVMLRYLDYNDTGIGGHPSDMIPALLAVAQMRGASGAELVRGVHVAYEIHAALRRGGMMLRAKHVDQLQVVIAAAVGASVVMRLDRERIANAISLAVTPNIPLRVTRTGELSDWKGCATAQGAMMAVFAVRLAEAGMSGPPEPFDGVAGLRDLLDLTPLCFESVGRPCEGLSAVEQTGLKFYPSEYSSQGPIAAVLKLRDRIRPEQIERLRVRMHWGGWHEIGGGQGDAAEKWNPVTRESADHSLPYLLAVALVDRAITLDSFTPQRIADPALRPLMQRITVEEDPELTRVHAGELPRWPSSVECQLRDGTVLTEAVGSPHGHPLDPLDRCEIESKFAAMSADVLGEEDRERVLDSLWWFETVGEVGPWMQWLCGRIAQRRGIRR